VILSPELTRLRADSPREFAALDELGKRGAVEIDYLHPAAVAIEPYLLDLDLITRAALVSAMRFRHESVAKTVGTIVRLAHGGWLRGHRWSVADLEPYDRERFDELHAAAREAAARVTL
jgi:hypothetical protein